MVVDEAILEHIERNASPPSCACTRLEKYPPFPPTLKALLHKLHGFPKWAVKPPLEKLPEEKIESALEEIQDFQAAG